jgi:hypothetical protein
MRRNLGADAQRMGGSLTAGFFFASNLVVAGERFFLSNLFCLGGIMGIAPSPFRSGLGGVTRSFLAQNPTHRVGTWRKPQPRAAN